MQIQGKFHTVINSPIGKLAIFANKSNQITDVRHILNTNSSTYEYGERPVRTEVLDNSGQRVIIDPYYELVGQPVNNLI